MMRTRGGGRVGFREEVVIRASIGEWAGIYGLVEGGK
jgi:hypothetical protein